MNYRDLGMRVRHLRLLRGYTQEELAKQLGISASFLGHIERGTRVASLDTLISLCNVLDVAPEFLLQASLGCYPDQESDEEIPSGHDNLGDFFRMAENLVDDWSDE